MEFAQANVGSLLVLGLILVIVAVGLRADKSGSRAPAGCAFSSEGDASTGPKAKGTGSVRPATVGENQPAHQNNAASNSARPARLVSDEVMAADTVGAPQRTTVAIYGLGCGGGGALSIERALARTTGVRRVYVNPATEMAYVEYIASQITLTRIVAIVQDLGFEAGQPRAVG